MIAALGALDGVTDVHHVHGWALTGGRHVFSAHVLIDGRGADPQSVLTAAHEVLKTRFGFYFSTLQIESECLDESAAQALDVFADKTAPDHGDKAHGV